MSKEYPILFSTPMVQAILEGRKTMTRRIIKNVPNDIKGTITWGYSAFTPKGYISLRTKYKTDKGHHYGEKFFKLPYGGKGDTMWVREAWHITGWDFEGPDCTVEFATGERESCYYPDPNEDCSWLIKHIEKLEKRGYIKKDEEDEEMFVFTEKKYPFWPSIHMPKDFCRIELEITDIKVERLQDIDENDVRSEGAGMEVRQMWLFGADKERRNSIYRRSFETLWTKINGEESWNENPFVWAIEFKKL